MSEDEVKGWLRVVLGVDDAAIRRLDMLAALLVEENERQNLIAKGTIPALWDRHVLDSAQLLSVSRETIPEGLWLDLGTGAGFPGLVIAALRPDQPILLVDSRRRRTEWLERAAEAMGLPNVEVALARVEDLPLRAASVISARAFAHLSKLVELSARFSTPQTLWLLPKGASAQHELQMLPEKWRHAFHVEQSLTDSDAGIIVGQLLAATPGCSSPKGKGKRT